MSDIELLGAVYPDVPAVTLPKSGGGQATFYEVSPYDSNPEMDGTAAAGSSADYARGDHVHPTDTSRAPSSHSHGDITSGGDITASSAVVAPGDCIVINDESESKITNGPAFGSETNKFLRNDGTWQLLEMTILSYGHSTWAEAEAAFLAHNVVYCRASSNSNPATGTQGRMAFLAYTNSATTPTEFEFQYYRSVSTHTDSQQGDQVYVYKLNKTKGWSVTVRSAFSRVIAGDGLSLSYATDKITLSSKVRMVSVTLAAAGWSNNEKSVSVTGVTASNMVIVQPAPASAEEWNSCGVFCKAQAAGSLTFKCSSAITNDLTVNVLYSA